MKLTEFQLGSYETALSPGELVAAILIPPPTKGLEGRYVKFTTGSSEERPCAGVAAFAQMEDGICRELRLAIGAVSPRSVRISTAEQSARDMILTRQLIDDIAFEAARVVEPIDDVRGPADYKRHLVRVLARRTIAALADGATEAKP